MFTRLPSRVSFSRAYSTRPNNAIIDLLQKCLKEENSSPTRNAYKVRSFQNAIATIYEHEKPIRSGKEASKLRGIGSGIANRIDFFLQGKEYDEATEAQAKARLLAVETFQKIPGIGIGTATALVNAGASSFSDLDLPQYTELLSPAQKVNVRYRDHLTTPVSRAAAEEVMAFIRDHISTNFEIHFTGAYRRDEADLPDVCLLLHHRQHIHIPIPQPPPPPASTANNPPRIRTRGIPPMPFYQVNPSLTELQSSPLLQDVVRPLDAAGLVAAPLTSRPHRWRGIAVLPLRNGDGAGWKEVGDRLRDQRARRGTYFRLDLTLAPLKSRGAAQLALTGDYEFLRIARMAAVRHGMHLDEYGLWRWHDSLEGGSDCDVGAGYWELVEGESEERILEEIGLGEVPPGRRNFRYVAGRRRVSARAGKIDLSVEQSPSKLVVGRPRLSPDGGN